MPFFKGPSLIINPDTLKLILNCHLLNPGAPAATPTGQGYVQFRLPKLPQGEGSDEPIYTYEIPVPPLSPPPAFLRDSHIRARGHLPPLSESGIPAPGTTVPSLFSPIGGGTSQRATSQETGLLSPLLLQGLQKPPAPPAVHTPVTVDLTGETPPPSHDPPRQASPPSPPKTVHGQSGPGQ